MPQDLGNKRRNLATNAIIQATRLVDALVALQELQAEFAQCGTFLQAEFDGTSLQHVTPGMLAAVFAGSGVVDSLTSWYGNNTTVGTTGVVNKQNLLQLRS